MKLLFSEYNSDYNNYVFPYAIWAIPEAHETPAMIFDQGFLPSSRQLDRFYLCRQIRIDLKKFSRSSENRRILKKGEGIYYQLYPREQFPYSDDWREFFKNYADIKFGKDVMTYQRLDSLFHSKIISHILLFTDQQNNRDVGVVTLYLESNVLAYYYYSFYDLSYYRRNLGLYMMTSAVDYFAQQDYAYLYLGTCYSKNALYKTQFSGIEFFNGFRWSNDLKELKYLIERDKMVMKQHLVETEDYVKKFYNDDLRNIFQQGGIKVFIK